MWSFVGVVAFAISSSADIFTVSYSTTFTSNFVAGDPSTGGHAPNISNQAVSLPQWDATLFNTPEFTMQLVQVQYSVVGYLYGTYSVENVSGEPVDALITTTATGAWNVRGANTAVGVNQSPLSSINNNSFTGPGADIVGANLIEILFTGIAEGTTVAGTTDYMVSSPSPTVTENTANLGLYTGNGTVTFRINGRGATTADVTLSSDGGTATSIQSLTTFKAATVTVTYTYVPEVSPVAAICALSFGIGAVAYRRRMR
jgi:hypothetical protein